MSIPTITKRSIIQVNRIPWRDRAKNVSRCATFVVLPPILVPKSSMPAAARDEMSNGDEMSDCNGEEEKESPDVPSTTAESPDSPLEIKLETVPVNVDLVSGMDPVMFPQNAGQYIPSPGP